MQSRTLAGSLNLTSSALRQEVAEGDTIWWSLCQIGLPITNYDIYVCQKDLAIWSETLIDIFWHVVSRIRFLFYMVWPTETMFESLDRVPRYVTEMFPVFVLAAVIESAARMFQGKCRMRMNETVGSLSQGIFQECLRIKIRSIEVLAYCLVWENFRLIELPWNSLWTWWLCYIAVDLGFYWAHRLAHEVNFIWAIHQAHHSSEEFSVLSALRQAVLQPFTAWFTYVPLALAIPPQIFLAHLQLSELYMAWLHTEVVDKIGPLEYILNTPSHHRVHHSRDPSYIDKNYGGMLIIWDRLFKTFKEEDPNIKPAYGLVHPVKAFNPITVQFHTWPVIFRRLKKSKNLNEKLGVLFKGPGWRPGLPRLGNPQELPAVKFPLEPYNPELSWIKSVYIIVHFGLLLLFYHELTLYQSQVSSVALNVGVIALLASITSFGIMMDCKSRLSHLGECMRCLLFIHFRQDIFSVLDIGLEKSGIDHESRVATSGKSIIDIVFLFSLAINAILTFRELVGLGLLSIGKEKTKKA